MRTGLRFALLVLWVGRPAPAEAAGLRLCMIVEGTRGEGFVDLDRPWICTRFDNSMSSLRRPPVGFLLWQ